jgi:hypothetical protein
MNVGADGNPHGDPPPHPRAPIRALWLRLRQAAPTLAPAARPFLAPIAQADGCVLECMDSGGQDQAPSTGHEPWSGGSPP